MIQLDRPTSSKRRWIICGLLFAATAINYVDRQMIGILKPILSREYSWSETDYGTIVFWFQAAYAIGYLGFGRFIDKVGARLGYSTAVVVWSIAHICHAFITGLASLTLARIGLGLGESGNFPAGLKAVTDWFPKKERALATGIFNAGANIGAIITPLIVPIITIYFGWRMAFIITGFLTIAWLIAWWLIYKLPQHDPKVSEAELALIQSDPKDVPVTISWSTLIRRPETWGYAGAKFLIDPIWWMFLFWLPDFFAKRHHLDLKSFGPPLVAVYIMSDLGSIAGGYLSSRLLSAGYSLNSARKIAMLVSAIAVLPIFGAAFVDDLWTATLLVGIATAAHQAFSCNLYNYPGDIFPRFAVASVVGIGGAAGAIGGMLMAKYAGFVLDTIGSYGPIFAVAGSVYFVALAVVHWFSPHYDLVELEPTSSL